MKKLFNKSNTVSIANCLNCKLDKTCETPKMPYSGQGKKGILIVGEAPGKTEDEEGKQFIGAAGKTLRSKLKNVGIDVDRDCWITNAIICRPPKNRTPSLKEINYCLPNLQKTVEQLKPKKIFIFGKVPLQAVFQDRVSIDKMERWIGEAIPDQKWETWIFPMYHPQYLNYNKDDEALWNEFDRVLLSAVEHNEVFKKWVFSLDLIRDVDRAEEVLRQLQKQKIVAFDYETTGLKPYAQGHEIVCVSFAWSKDKAASFPIYDRPSFKRELRKLLTGPVKKVAHNIKFEELWTRKIFGYSVNNWELDTQLAAHSIDNRTGKTSLKFQGFVNFGIGGYEKDIKKYIEAAKEDGINGFNNMKKAPLSKTLKYCAIDSLLSFRLWEKQKDLLTKHTKKGYDLFHDGNLSFVDTEDNGICLDFNYIEKQNIHLQRRIDKEYEKIKEDKAVQSFEKKESSSLDINSHQQLAKLLYGEMQLTPPKQTKKGNPSTDAESLEQLQVPFVKHLLKYRKLLKLKNTYLHSFTVNAGEDKKLHPNFNLNIPKTYRSSSDSPNFQNVPNRDKEAQKIIRTAVIPSPGNKLIKADYSGIEVKISACYHKDPAMIQYIEDPNTDMHRDQAREIFVTDDIDKDLRYVAKNMFVFPQFYGSYFLLNAKDIWSVQGLGVREALKAAGIKSLKSLESHMKKVEDRFWNERFHVYRDWKKQTYKKYLKTGYINIKTGFVCRGIMSRNEVLNYPIQGAAFHCLLWSKIQINKWLKENKMKSKIIGQIHDEIDIDLFPEEQNLVLPKLKQIMCEEIRKFWSWIIVPLEIEIEISQVDGNWYDMEEIEI